jgi:hypothetical protein
VPNFGEHKKDKRQKFWKELALVLIIPHARHTLKVQRTIARYETSHSQLQHFTGTLTSYKHHSASFSTAQEMLPFFQIKGQGNQIYL